MKYFKSFGIAALLIFFVTGLKAQEVSVFSGFWALEYYEDDVQITKKDFEALLLKNQDANTYWIKTKRKRGLIYAALVSQTGFLTWMLLEDSNSGNIIAPFIGVLGSGAAGIVFINQANKAFKKTILEYNKGFDKKVSLNIGASGNGIGIALQF